MSSLRTAKLHDNILLKLKDDSLLALRNAVTAEDVSPHPVRRRKVAPPVEQMLWYSAKGKPREIIEHHGALAVTTLTDAELKECVAKLLAKLP